MKLSRSIAGSASSTSPPLLKLGQSLTGKVSTYTVTRQLGEFIWQARYAPIIGLFDSIKYGDPIMTTFSLTHIVNSDKSGQTVIIKAARHFRIMNERDVLRKFQDRTPHLRPLVDEITEPLSPPAIVLKHLEDDLWAASGSKKLSGREIRYVSKRILEALKVLHDDGYVHTG